MILKKILILISLLLTIQTAHSQSVTKQPYIIWPGNSEIVIRVEVDAKTECFVNYGLETKKMVATVKGVLRGMKENHYLYEFKLNNLIADSKYYYQVLVGNEECELAFFHTYKQNEKTIHFVAMGDSRSNPDIFEVVMHNIKQNPPNLIISMGDLVRKGGVFNEWDQFYFNIAKEVIDKTPLISALGDHEGNDDNGELFRHYLLTNQPLEKQWFSFDYGDAHFIALDYRYPNSTEMIKWFINDISKSDAHWKFVYMHRPCYNFSGHHSTWGSGTWPELFRKYKIDIVFAGHSHIYERFYPMMPFNNTDSWPVTYITTGGAGAGLYNKTGNYTSLAYTESVNHFVDVYISGDTLNLRTIKNDQSQIDSLTIIKHGDTHNKEYLNLVINQDEVDLQSSFISAISLSLKYVPLGSNRTPGVDIEFYSGLEEDIPFIIELDDESVKNYNMKPIRGVLHGNKKEIVHLHITGNTENVCVHKWGELTPLLKIKILYELRGEKEKIISLPAKYWY